MPLSCLRSALSKSNSSIRLPLTTATRVSSRWRASISMRVVIIKSPRARTACRPGRRAMIGRGQGNSPASAIRDECLRSRRMPGRWARAQARVRASAGTGLAGSGLEEMRHANVNLMTPAPRKARAGG
ncbi:hypothetical protein SPHINGO361_130381 [Sphingomonas sp. EC-HK361]|nr:hypothetical protein SPHINGO361_130381 [Sphingomonas sp. EC-HK361]